MFGSSGHFIQFRVGYLGSQGKSSLSSAQPKLFSAPVAITLKLAQGVANMSYRNVQLLLAHDGLLANFKKQAFHLWSL